MRPLSASEAISPALDRTKDLLARPFYWRTFFKIATVAFFAEFGGGGFNFSTPSRGGSIHDLPPAFLAFIVAFAVILGVVSIIVGLILFYVGSRLQLVLVELVATRQTLVGPVWRRVSQATWRWIGLKLLFIFATVLLFLLLAIPAIVYFISHHSLPGFAEFFQLHLAQIILLVAAFILVLLIALTAYMLVRDFALPFIALEDLSISESLRRVLSMLSAEPGAFALYLLLRILLAILFAVAAEMCVVLIVLISLIPSAVVGGGLWFALHSAGPGGIAALIACAVVGGLIFLAWLIFLGISAFGSVFTFLQAYSLYFLGGRYQMLGDLLDRTTPPPYYSYAVGFSTPYHTPPTPPPPPSIP